MTPADALAQANRTLAEKNEELNEMEGEDTPSESSDGTFRFIDQVNFPVAPTESELNNMSLADRIFAIDRYKKDFDVADTLLLITMPLFRNSFKNSGACKERGIS